MLDGDIHEHVCGPNDCSTPGAGTGAKTYAPNLQILGWARVQFAVCLNHMVLARRVPYDQIWSKTGISGIRSRFKALGNGPGRLSANPAVDGQIPSQPWILNLGSGYCQYKSCPVQLRRYWA